MKHISFFVLALAFTFAFSSCDKSEPEEENIPADELIERKDIPLTRSQQEFVKSNNAFALELFRKVSGKEDGKSMLISPISVTYSLGMVDNGAQGETRNEINKVLGYSGESVKDLNDFCKTMLSQGAAVDPTTKISFTNMAVVNNRYIPLKNSFTNDVRSIFEANVIYKDFLKDNIVSLVNSWCEEKTNGMIKNFLSSKPKDTDYAYFLNATYFKGAWSTPFDKGVSKKGDFTDIDGKKLSVNMMIRHEKILYQQITGLCSAVCLPYGNKAYRMILVLPEEGKTLDYLKERLTTDNWSPLTKMSSSDVILRMPSFECEFGTTSLKESLKEMGIVKAFKEHVAEFKGMSDVDLYIGEVLHKAKIKVDEQGTEAAAVTSVGMTATSPGPGYEHKVIEFYADRPFLYAITEVSTGAIFFIGQYTGK
ncbi:MAG: serpin family protein [Bacteroidales bacterium]|nr:serpin family protein [Bacteroidales bacterium]